MEVIVGFAEGVAVIVTCAWPDFVVSATLVAEMVTVFGVGTAVGAVYNPAVLIMPTTEVPPDVPLTAHVTAVLYAPVPVTVAANCWVPPLCTDEEGGFTATAVMVGVGGGGGGCVGCDVVAEPPPHPTSRKLRMAKNVEKSTSQRTLRRRIDVMWAGFQVSSEFTQRGRPYDSN